MDGPGRRTEGRGEQGQVLLLFVVVFSVILTLGAFAVDQGLWFAKRGVSQKDADLAARGGAIALAPGPLTTTACDVARKVAAANLVAGAVDCVPSPDCQPAAVGGRSIDAIAGAPSIDVTVHRSTSGLFSRLPLIGGGSGSTIDTLASSTACLGATTRLHIGAAAPQAVPLAMAASDGDAHSCFAGGNLIYGTECVIFGTATCGGQQQGGNCQGGNAPAVDSAIVTDPMRGCYTGGTSGIARATREGTTFDCTRGSDTIVVSDASGSGSVAGSARDQIFAGMRDRLRGNASCGRNSPFQAAFGYGDASTLYARGPAPFASNPDSPATVYVQNGCSPATDPPLGDTRVAVLPIVVSAPGANARGVSSTVSGFAVVYITGCFKSDDRFPARAALNTCASPGSSGNAGWEVRAVPLRLLMVGESLGNIATTSANAPLTIQTVK